MPFEWEQAELPYCVEPDRRPVICCFPNKHREGCTNTPRPRAKKHATTRHCMPKHLPGTSADQLASNNDNQQQGFSAKCAVMQNVWTLASVLIVTEFSKLSYNWLISWGHYFNLFWEYVSCLNCRTPGSLLSYLYCILYHYQHYATVVFMWKQKVEPGNSVYLIEILPVGLAVECQVACLHRKYYSPLTLRRFSSFFSCVSRFCSNTRFIAVKRIFEKESHNFKKVNKETWLILNF